MTVRLRPKKGGLGLGGCAGSRNANAMAHKHKGSQKTFASKRTMNPSFSGHKGKKLDMNEAFPQQDAKRRLGGFETAGEHARTGNRGHQ
jgi:hypothetical protein